MPTSFDALSHRPCTGDNDFRLMQELVRKRYAASLAERTRLEDQPSYPSPGDLDWWRCTSNNPAMPSNIELWFDADQLTAFVWHNGEDASIVLSWRRDDLYPGLLAWAEERTMHYWREGNQQEAPVFEEPCLSWNQRQREVLQSRGYALVKECAEQDHWFDLTGDLPPRRTLPAGFVVRALAGDHEVEARVSVHRSAFAPSRMTVEKYRAVMAAPTYRRDLDLVVEAPAWPEGVARGTEGCADSPCFAAFTIVWYDEGTKRGVFEPVGCRPEFQRRGLASAVMFEGMHRLRDAGATHCWVGAHGGSPGALTYRAIGGYPAQQFDLWRRTLPVASHRIAPLATQPE